MQTKGGEKEEEMEREEGQRSCFLKSSSVSSSEGSCPRQRDKGKATGEERDRVKRKGVLSQSRLVIHWKKGGQRERGL